MKKRRALVFLYICVISLLTGSAAMSLAWFTSGNYLTVQYFDITFQANDDLKIAANNIEGEFGDEISDDQLQDSDLFVPVSSMFSSNWMASKATEPIFYGQNDRNGNKLITSGGTTYVQPKEMVSTQGFYSQAIYLKSEDDHWAYLDCSGANSYVNADPANNLVQAKKLLSDSASQSEIDEVVAKLNNLENSMRVSILVDNGTNYDYKIFDPHKNGTTYFGGVIDSECKGMFDVKSGSEMNYEVFYGDVSNRDKIIYSYNENLNKKLNPTWYDSGHYGNTQTIDVSASINNGVVVAAEPSITFDQNQAEINKLINGQSINKDNTLLIPLQANVATRIVVSVYMEGWDIDNVDSTMGGSFQAQLTFGLLDRHII